MKKVKINLALMALLMAGTAAVAFKPAPVKTNQLAPVSWVRTGSEEQPELNSWQQGSTGTCIEAERVCKATFESGYDPNSHTYLENQAAMTITQDEGVVEP